jgi:hypothetical protein
MKNCLVLFAVFVGLLMAAGCSEGPVFPEDRSAVAKSAEKETPTDEGDSTKKEKKSVEEEFVGSDPEEAKKIEEQKKKKEEEKKQEEVAKEAKADAGKVADVLYEHVHFKRFDEAIKVFELNKEDIELTAKKEMEDSRAGVREGYKMWRDGLFDVYRFLKESDLDPEQKAKKAEGMIDNASQAKRSAEFAKSFE